MKFKNVSDQVKMFKVNGLWVSVSPDKIADLPEDIDLRTEGLEAVGEPQIEPKVEPEVKKETNKFIEESVLAMMKKDELNDYASDIGFKELTTKYTKKTMIQKIIEFIKGLINE